MTNIVIVSRGRINLLRQTIESLSKNTDKNTFTLTIVSDEGADGDFRCTRYLQSLNRKHVSILEVQNSGHVLAQLKNLGAYYSEQRFGRADWLYLSDSDVYFLPGWMDQLTTLAVHSEWDGFKLWGGQVHPFHHPQEGGSWCLALRCRYAAAQQLHDLTMYDYSVLDGPSWLMRWSTWDSIGPLSRTCALGACQSEDAEWCSRLVASGGRIGVIQPHVVIHTGLANSNGDPAPGFAERRALIPPGVLAE